MNDCAIMFVFLCVEFEYKVSGNCMINLE